MCDGGPLHMAAGHVEFCDGGPHIMYMCPCTCTCARELSACVVFWMHSHASSSVVVRTILFFCDHVFLPSFGACVMHDVASLCMIVCVRRDVFVACAMHDVAFFALQSASS